MRHIVYELYKKKSRTETCGINYCVKWFTAAADGS